MPVWNVSPVVNTPSRLLALPVEIQNEIIDVLDMPSKLALKITNVHFNSLIRLTHQDLLATEQSLWARRKCLYTCMDCCRLRPSQRFADAMRKGRKGINGQEPQKRFCIDCGIHPKPQTTRYSPGAEIAVDGRRYVLCKRCRKYTEEVGCVGSGVCGRCHTRLGCKCSPSTKIEIPRNRAAVNERRNMAHAYEDDWADLPDYYDDYFWETYDPAD
jgi:hypothetical protein